MAEKTETQKIEREYIIPLRKEWAKVPRYKRAKKAIKAIRKFLVRHMKIYDRDLKKIKIDKYLNEEIWFRGIKKPPAKIKIKAIKEGEIVKAELAEMPKELEFKKKKEEKLKQKVGKVIEKRKEERKEEKEDKEVEEKKEASKDLEMKLEKEISKQEKQIKQQQSKALKSKAQVKQRKALEK